MFSEARTSFDSINAIESDVNSMPLCNAIYIEKG